MKSVNVAELKNQLSACLDEARKDEETVVRDRHTPVARIVPIAQDAGAIDSLRRLVAEGRIRPGGTPLDDTFWDLPAPRVRRSDLKRALDWDRDGD